MVAIGIQDCDAKLIYFQEKDTSALSSLKDTLEAPYFGLHVQHMDRTFLISHTFRDAKPTSIPVEYKCILCKSEEITSDCYIATYELINEKEFYNNPHISENDVISFNEYICPDCHQKVSKSIEKYIHIHLDQITADLL